MENTAGCPKFDSGFMSSFGLSRKRLSRRDLCCCHCYSSCPCEREHPRAILFSQAGSIYRGFWAHLGVSERLARVTKVSVAVPTPLVAHSAVAFLASEKLTRLLQAQLPGMPLLLPSGVAAINALSPQVCAFVSGYCHRQFLRYCQCSRHQSTCHARHD